jgi:hypothetical protein
MNGFDPLVDAFRSERDALAELAPAPDLPALWCEVGVRRERRLQLVLVLMAAVPTLLLFLGGVASLLLGGGPMSALPLVGVALWLVVGGAGDFTPLPLFAGEGEGKGYGLACRAS